MCIRENACAGQDSAVVRVEDAVIDADGQAQVVGVDYEAAQHGRLLSMRNTCAARTLPAENSRHGAAPRSCHTNGWFSNVRCSSCTITQTSGSRDGTPMPESDAARR